MIRDFERRSHRVGDLRADDIVLLERLLRSEGLREFFGPGWRMYYIRQGSTLIVMLGGGDKSTQDSDIARAQSIAQELRHEQDQDPAI